ncbi:MAG: S9 family peptidase [bacterium]
MKSVTKFFSIIFLLAVFSNLFPQQDSTLLTLERIFNSREFSGERSAQIQWIDDGKHYVTFEKSTETPGGRDIVKVETETGSKEIIASASLFIPEGSDEPLWIDDYDWSNNFKMILIFTNTERVWRYNTRGDYYVLDLESKKLVKLGGDAKPSTLMFAKFSPDDKKVAFVRENNLYVEELKNGKITQLTFDGSKTIINGTFDWVYEEELDCRDGFRWSPDGERIAYWQLDVSGVRDFYLINTTDSLYSFCVPVQYPKAGETNSSCKVGVINNDGGETIWMNIPGDPRNNYIAKMEWAENSNELCIQHLNRPQNKNEVMMCHAETGDVKTIFIDIDAAWVDIYDDIVWINDGEKFIFQSERDGWRHIYAVSRDGKEIQLLTPGAFDVISVENIDEENGWIYFIASPQNATQKYLYRVTIDVTGKIEKVTPDKFTGSNSYQISDGANYAVHSFSTFDNPRIVEWVKLPQHETIKTTVENKTLKEKLNSLRRSPSEFFNVTLEDGTSIDGWMMKPPDFDPSKKYPVFLYLYGEPAGQTVIDQYFGSQYLWHLMLTQKGYIVASIDNRGTPAPKGRQWRKIVYGNVGTITANDQADAMRAMIEKYSFIDPERIGVWGWSGGGVSTLNLLFRYPEIFNTGIAVAAVSDERFYDTIYSERYMGLPFDNAEGYRLSAPITYANQLTGNLLMVHGTGDDNVHYQNIEVLMNELIKHNKQFTVMPYPQRTHGIYEGEGTTIHLYTLMTNYLLEHLPAGGR